MAYSRWGSSIWYTYWLASTETKKQKQCFIINGGFGQPSITFTYEELSSDIEKCLNKAIKNESKMLAEKKKVTNEEREELKEYMLRFIQDVNKNHKERSE